MAVCRWQLRESTPTQLRAATEDDEAIAKSRGGNTTKIHLSVAACGYPVAFEITGGNIHDSTAAPQLLAQTLDAESVIADRGYDSEALREQIVEQGGASCYSTQEEFSQG